MLVMETMKRIADRYGLQLLLHEKPFAGADRQRIVSSEGPFFRHGMTSLKVCGNRQRPRG
jgi:hypothetical protein